MIKFSKNTSYLVGLILLSGIMLFTSACISKAPRVVSNYYILDYYKSTENPRLVLQKPYAFNLEIAETMIPKTYNRNQIVVKEHFSKIKYLSNELWASRLYDAIPNLMVQRFKAYNIFQRVDRDLGEINPDYYLETQVLNIEMIEGEKPLAFIRMEFFLRESASQKIVLSYQNQASRALPDRSIVYLVQTFNELIMIETDVFAAKTIEFLSGKSVYKAPQITLSEAAKVNKERMETDDNDYQYGELLIPLINAGDYQMQYVVYELDDMKSVTGRDVGEFDFPLRLKPGKYKAVLDDNGYITVEFDINAQLRTVVQPIWGELIVKIIDEAQTRVRMSYDIYYKNPNEDGFTFVNQSYSVGDEEIGEYDKIWLLKPGNYLIKLQGGSWSEYRDFATVDITENNRKTFTMVVNPQGERTVLIGAGVLGDDILQDRKRIHRGAVHTNVSLSSNNSVDKDKPVRSFSMSGQFDNRIEYHLLNFHYSMRSLYDVGMNISTGSEFKINVDDYSFRNTLILLPFEKRRIISNLGLYGRADLSTHFFDEYQYYSSDRNIMLLNAEGDTLSILAGQSSLRTKIAFFPMRLREGSGVTYRVVFSPSVSLSIRGGYGWQQEYKQMSYVLDKTNQSYMGQNYDVFKQESDIITRGYESTLIFTALNVMKFFSVTSTFDVLFPMETADKEPKFFNENRFNIRLFRNVSLDVKADIKYDKADKDYVIFDYSSFLRLSLYY